MDLLPIKIYVELPFWSRVPDDFVCSLPEVHDKPFELTIYNDFYRFWVSEIRKDYQTNIFIGDKSIFNTDKLHNKGLWEKCRTVVAFTLFETEQCGWTKAIRNKEDLVLKGYIQRELIPMINTLLIERYRAVTYDQSVYELNSWDLPVWHLQVGDERFYNFILCRYLSFDNIPHISEYGKPETLRPWHLSEKPYEDFNNPDISLFLPYEKEMLDAYNLKLRGNYKDALRRIVSAFEILFDQIIIDEKVRQGESEETATNSVYGTIAWWKKKELYELVFNKKLTDTLETSLLSVYEEARNVRNNIVHQGLVIKPEEKGTMRYLIDHTRFAINAIDPNSERTTRRDILMVKTNNEDYEFFD